MEALSAPCIEIKHTAVEQLGPVTWRVDVGLANTGWLPAYVTEKANNDSIVRPILVELDGADVIGGVARQEVGQLVGPVCDYFWCSD